MTINRGKSFEQVIRDAFKRVPGVSIDRLHDQTTGFRGSQNICDFIVYREPYEHYVECKTVHGNTLPFQNITDTQWLGLLEKSTIEGVSAGIMCWWVDKDVTAFIPITVLELYKQSGHKSIRFDDVNLIIVPGEKKKVFFEYDMEVFLDELSNV